MPKKWWETKPLKPSSVLKRSPVKSQTPPLAICVTLGEEVRQMDDNTFKVYMAIEIKKKAMMRFLRTKAKNDTKIAELARAQMVMVSTRKSNASSQKKSNTRPCHQRRSWLDNQNHRT